MQIILKVVNPKSGLEKLIDATDYKVNEMVKTFATYMKVGYKLYVVDGIDEILRRGK